MVGGDDIKTSRCRTGRVAVHLKSQDDFKSGSAPRLSSGMPCEYPKTLGEYRGAPYDKIPA